MQFTTQTILALAAAFPAFINAAAIPEADTTATTIEKREWNVVPGECGVHVEMHVPDNAQWTDGNGYQLSVELKDSNQNVFATYGSPSNKLASPANIDSILKDVFIARGESDGNYVSYALGADAWSSTDKSRCSQGGASSKFGSDITVQIDCDFACPADAFTTTLVTAN